MPPSALAECLVGPAERREQAVRAARDGFARLPIEIVDLNAEIAIEAARLRSRHRSLRLPGALVIAASMVAEADQLVTTDGGWPTQHKPRVAVEIVTI